MMPNPILRVRPHVVEIEHPADERRPAGSTPHSEIAGALKARVPSALVLVLFVLLGVLPFARAADEKPVGPDGVTVKGKLILKTFPGPPNYEDVAKGDKPETVYVIVLTHEMDAKVTDDFDNTAVVKGIEVLMVLPVPGADKASLRKNLDKEVVAKGSLIFPASSHHHTRVVLVTKSVQSQEKK